MTGERSQFIPVGATFYHVVPDGRGVEWIAKPKDGDDARWEFLTPMATAMRAVNAHDALVAACEAVLANITNGGTANAYPRFKVDRWDEIQKLTSALALAKGEKP